MQNDNKRKRTKRRKPNVSAVVPVAVETCPLSLDTIEPGHAISIQTGTRIQIYDVNYLWKAVSVDPEHRDPVTRLPIDPTQLQKIIDQVRHIGILPALNLPRLTTKVKIHKWASQLCDFVTAMRRSDLAIYVEEAAETSIQVLFDAPPEPQHDKPTCESAVDLFQRHENYTFFAVSVGMALQGLRSEERRRRRTRSNHINHQEAAAEEEDQADAVPLPIPPPQDQNVNQDQNEEADAGDEEDTTQIEADNIAIFNLLRTFLSAT